MKRISLLFICFALFSGFYHNPVWAGDIKIGVLNMKRLQQNSAKFQKIREELRTKFNALQKKLDAEREQINKIEEELRKQSMMLSLDAKEDKKRELEKKQRHYKYLAEEYTREMQAAEVEAKKRIGKELSRVVEKIGKEEGYTLIFERRTVGLLYYDHALDITEKVAAAYDESKNP